MLFIKKTSSRKNNFLSLAIKLIFLLLIIFVTVFLLNKIDFPAPTKEIEKIISNENFKIVK
jgi:flagellar biogenesis protein FliO